MTRTSEIARQFCPHCGAWMNVTMEHWKCEVVAQREAMNRLLEKDHERFVDDFGATVA